MKLNKKEKALVKSFNQPDSHLVISHWPNKSNNFDGIATYTQDTVLKLAKYSGDKFIVLAEGEEFSIKKIKKNVLLIRAFDEKRIHLYPQILFWLKNFKLVKKVYVHSEFCASGGPSLRLLVIPFLALIKVLGREISFYAHNIVTDFSLYASHFGQKENSALIKLWNWGYQTYFRFLSLFVDQFIVLEDVLKKRLSKLVKKEVLVHPHWIDIKSKKLSKAQAKKKLGFKTSDKLVLSFGFITHYKGADFLANFAKYLDKNKKLTNVKVVLAGGEAYSLKDKDYYHNFYNKITELSLEHENLFLTGFLSDKEIDLWMTAADLLIFPYRDLMGGSGAMQQALQYEKPFLISKKMAKNLAFINKDFTFAYNFKDLAKLVDKYFSNQSYRRDLNTFIERLIKSISIEELLPKHYNEVYQNGSKKNSWFKLFKYQ